MPYPVNCETADNCLGLAVQCVVVSVDTGAWISFLSDKGLRGGIVGWHAE